MRPFLDKFRICVIYGQYLLLNLAHAVDDGASILNGIIGIGAKFVSNIVFKELFYILSMVQSHCREDAVRVSHPFGFQNMPAAKG